MNPKPKQKTDVELNILAIAIFVMTISSLLSPIFNISPFLPAGATFIILSLLTLDNLSFQSKGLSVFLDLFASKEQRERVLHHEAGHFITAYFLGIPIQDYTLTAWESIRAGYYGNGGVVFDASEVTAQPFNLSQTRLTLDRFCTVWMAGIAAEKLMFEDAEGGSEDYQQLGVALKMAGLSPQTHSQKARWGQVQATNLIQRNEESYQALIEAMKQRKTVAQCCEVIQEHCVEEVVS